jgi:hypothetical protein
MGKVITSVILVLIAAVFLTMVSVVRDVLPKLDEKEQGYLRSWRWGTVAFDRALRSAWNEHCRLFPHSRKRVLLGFLFALALLLTLSYPLWTTLLLSR